MAARALAHVVPVQTQESSLVTLKASISGNHGASRIGGMTKTAPLVPPAGRHERRGSQTHFRAAAARYNGGLGGNESRQTGNQKKRNTVRENPLKPFHERRALKTISAVQNLDAENVTADVAAADQGAKTYHFLVANAQFMLDEEEHFQEQLKERLRYFKDSGREQDFWLVHEPAFLDSMPEIAKRIKRPCTALVSTDGPWITFMKLRLDRVLKGEFKAPSEEIPDAFVSKADIGDFEVQTIEKWMAPYPKYASKWWEPFLHQ